MSSVNPSDTYNGYYIKHLSDLEDELKGDYKRAEQRSKENVEQVTQKYNESARKNSERADENVDRIRDNMQEHYDRSRADERAELEKIKAQNYDRFGRDRSNEADSYRERLNEVSRGVEAERASHERHLADAETGAEHKNQEIAKQYQDRMDRTLAAQHEAAQHALDEQNRTQKGELGDQRDEASKKYEALNDARSAEQAEARRRTETVIADSKRDMDNLTRHLNGSVDERLDKDHKAGIQREQAAAEHLKKSHDLQSRDLREQVSALLSHDSVGPKEIAKARAEAVRDYEDEWRARVAQVDDAGQKQINKLQQMASETDDRNADSSGARMRERDNYFAGLISKQATESHEEQKGIVGRYDAAIKETELRGRKDRDMSDKRLENTMLSANEAREEALKTQAENFQKSAATLKQNDQDSIDALQKQLNKKTNPTDEQDISPVAENAIRRSIVKQYAKNLNAETERNQRSADSMVRSYGDRLVAARDESQSLLTAREQQHQIEAHQSEVVLMDHISDVENAKGEALRTSEEEHGRQTETLNREHSKAQVKVRTEYESMIQNLRDDASSRIQTTRQESEFAMKSQQRAFSVQQNELIRGYEKKLADQKLDFDTRLEDIRNQTQQSVRDVERREKFNYEEQARTYDQRIAQIEDQHKERERSITQNFEDQLDKVKRSNALLQSKKS